MSINNRNIKKLFEDTELAFNHSPIKLYAEKNGYSWYYSISATRLVTDACVLIGFNWGASDKHSPYIPQAKIPDRNFRDLYNQNLTWLGSFARVYMPLKNYLPENQVDNAVLSNFCFFRSAKESQITQKDLELSTPLFHRLIEIINPNKIIGFSSKLRDHVIKKSKKKYNS